MHWEIVVTIMCAALGATGLFNLIQFLITRKDKKKNGHEALSKELDSLRVEIRGIRDDIDKHEAINARIRILQAADNIRHTTMIHSEEYFDQLNEDITLYENYCRDHENFKNNKAVHAIEYINEIYRKALTEDNFL